MPSVYLLLGSNEGNSVEYLQLASKNIEAEIGKIDAESSIYRTQAWGNTDQNDFYNQVLKINTRKWPATILKNCLDIEQRLGRIRTKKWVSRTIDIDILFYGAKIIDTPELKVPHPHFQNRKFAIIPMMELSPYFVHPMSKMTIEDIFMACEDELDVYLEDQL